MECSGWGNQFKDSVDTKYPVILPDYPLYIL